MTIISFKKWIKYFFSWSWYQPKKPENCINARSALLQKFSGFFSREAFFTSFTVQMNKLFGKLRHRSKLFQLFNLFAAAGIIIAKICLILFLVEGMYLRWAVWPHGLLFFHYLWALLGYVSLKYALYWVCQIRILPQ